MAIEKQGFNIPFGQGVDTKTDPNQVVAGKMLALENAVFQSGQLNKRAGFGTITELPNDAVATTLTTLNDNLIATGSDLFAYSKDTNEWLNRGTVQPVQLNVKSLVRNAASQSNADSAVANNNVVCTVYTQGSTAYYQINNSETGQIIIAQTALPSTASLPRVRVLGRYFVITFFRTVLGTPHLQYIAIPLNAPGSPTAAADLSTQVLSITTGYDTHVANDTLYVAWTGSDVGGAIRATYLTSTLNQGATIAITGYVADYVSITADTSGSTAIVYISFWDSGTLDGYIAARDWALVAVLAPTQIINGITIAGLTSEADAGAAQVFYQVENTYSYSAVRSDYIETLSVTITGVVSSASVVSRGVGLASKPFYNNGQLYLLTVYGGAYQPTYFLMDLSGNVIMKLAYSNGGGYLGQVLPEINLQSGVASVAYLFKDQLVSVNKSQGVASVGGIYAQTGINLAQFSINTSGQYSSEIAMNLHLTGGILWQYDAVKPVEHGFHLWPEDVDATTVSGGGSIAPQTYYYAFTYEWTDAQGMLHRSAPSIATELTFVGGPSDHTNTLKVPTLRQTYKVGNNPVRIVGYRWSTAQQTFYQFTSITSPTINDTSVDSVTITDTLSDADILGNPILYTTGGVVENIGAPANSAATLFKQRSFLVDAEEPNLIWYSKQVVANTPVEFSDLFTMYVAPTAISSGAPGSGPIRALASMDDKLIIFKDNAIYYVTGNGPDATGANNDFSEPTFVTSAVGCSNPRSIVYMPIGIMFQSNKGIWLLGRDLSTQYIGADVEAYNDIPVNSAITVPGTNEVRFTLDDGSVLMYDYYYGQWGSFTNVPAVSSTLYQNLHTYLNQYGIVRQQTPNKYLDGTSPVLMKFKSAWLKLTNLQGFQRAYFFYFLGKFLTPHKLSISIAYDYNNSTAQRTVITPLNAVDIYGDEPLYGSGSPYGGTPNVEQWRVFFQRQKCQSIQISMEEIYNPDAGIQAGAGVSLSGINLVVGGKGVNPRLPSKQSAG